jgi:serine/threonine protein kinase
MPQEIQLPKLTEEDAIRRIIKWLKSSKEDFYRSVNSPNYGHELYIPDVIIQSYQDVIDADKKKNPVTGMRQYSMNLESPETSVFYDAAWVLYQEGLLRPNPPNPHANGADINKGFTVTSKGKKWLSQVRGDEATLEELIRPISGTQSTEVIQKENIDQSLVPTLRKENNKDREGLAASLALTVQDRDEEQLLNNRYKILHKLSRGGFGQTFLAEDLFLPSKRKCVIKQLTYSSNYPDIQKLILERFELEAATLERLAESNEQIPKLYAHFSENSQFYLVQEWIKGETIADRVRVNGSFDEVTVRNLLISILQVLEYVHTNRIIHRDIKPENIILREGDSKPILIDFGAVKEIARTILDQQGNPTTTIFIGTPAFVPIEQATGRPQYASDLYSLGLTAIFMLTGKRPQELNDPSTGNIVWRDKAEGITNKLAEVLDKSIQYDFRDRFLVARTMLDAITSVNTPQQLPSSQNGLTGDIATEAEQVIGKDRNYNDELGKMNQSLSQTATWWLRSFLNPVIEVIRDIEKNFNQNSFILTAESIQPYSQVFNYRIDFFQREKWEGLLLSDVGEYFFEWFPSIKSQLNSFARLGNEFDRSLRELEKSVEGSSEYVNLLIDTYERLIQHERIPRHQYEKSSLQEIAVLLLGQLHLQLSNYHSEGKDNLVRLTTYTLLDLNVDYPMHVLRDDHKLLSFCREIAKSLREKDISTIKLLDESKRLFEVIKNESTSLLGQLKKYRIDIAKKSTATFD